MTRACIRLILVLSFLAVLAPAAMAQTGGAVVIKAADTATGATTDVGDNTNHALRVNIVAGAGSGGTAIQDNTAFTQGTTNETPAGCMYTTTWANPTSGRATICREDINGGVYVNIDKVGTSAITLGQKTMANSFPVVIASDQSNIPVTARPIDACGTTSYDPASLKIPDATLDTLTSTTTCVDTIVVVNVTSAQVTLTLQDQQGTPVQILNALPVAPGGTSVLNLAGMKFASGIKYQASVANSLSLWVKGRQ